jgi:hypothetical protein
MQYAVCTAKIFVTINIGNKLTSKPSLSQYGNQSKIWKICVFQFGAILFDCFPLQKFTFLRDPYTKNWLLIKYDVSSPVSIRPCYLLAVPFLVLPPCITIPITADLSAELIRLKADKQGSWRKMVLACKSDIIRK